MRMDLIQTPTTKITISPKIMKAITLLQYNGLELNQYIQKLALENPFIDIDKTEFNLSIEERYYTTTSKNSGFDSSNSTDSNYYLESTLSTPKSLYDYLHEQILAMKITDKSKMILEFLNQNIDDKGYLQINIDEVSKKLNISIEEAEKHLKLFQSLEPIGVGARTIRECLAIQLEKKFPHQKLAKKIIINHFELLASKNWTKIAEKLKVARNEVIEASQYIYSLQPYPTIHLSSETPQYLVPDIIINQQNNEFIISFNESYEPKIKINRYYQNLFRNTSNTFLKEKYAQYKWLAQSLEQRRITIRKVISSLVNKQKDFLRYGFIALKPLTYKEIADDIQMHESTVSRSLKNKVLQTPHGIFQAKQLFSSKLSNQQGHSVSSTKVKMIIQNMIDNEDPLKPLSDQKISEYLKNKFKISIARRTVTKYRKELGILSTRERRAL